MRLIRYSSYLILLHFSCCSNNGHKGNKINTINTETANEYSNDKTLADIKPYDYDTILKGGYTILFKMDDSLEHLYLKKGKMICQIASCSKDLPYKNLGYKVADFAEYLLLAHSFGSGNPNFIELINKETGKNILENRAILIDVNENKELFLYCLDSSSPLEKNRIILYDLKKECKKYFFLPKKNLNEPVPLTHIHIDTITRKSLVFD